MQGSQFLSTLALLALAGCGAQQGTLQIRSLPSGLAQGQRPVSFRVAEARAQFALGNVALALEGFRKAMREDPGSIDAAVGMAGCYVRMGRYDLSQRYYETALAIDPRNGDALADLAASFDVQGKTAEAAEVRSELALLTAPAGTAAATTLVLPQAEGAARTPALVPPADGPQRVEIAQAATATTIATPAIELQAAAAPAEPRVAQVVTSESRPRLERTSLGEVALITSGKPMWKSMMVSRSATSTTVRFIPLRAQATQQASVRLLNAARVNRLAARTRTFLAGKGWQRVAVGDAPAVRRTSLIVYPAKHRAMAERLAAQFGFALASNDRLSIVTVYLGRDAARRTVSRSSG
jgi:hypothetical protein